EFGRRRTHALQVGRGFRGIAAATPHLGVERRLLGTQVGQAPFVGGSLGGEAGLVLLQAGALEFDAFLFARQLVVQGNHVRRAGADLGLLRREFLARLLQFGLGALDGALALAEFAL